MTTTALRAPQAELTHRYAEARRSWASSSHLQAIARSMGIDEREFSDRYVRQNFVPLMAAALDANRAFEESL